MFQKNFSMLYNKGLLFKNKYLIPGQWHKNLVVNIYNTLTSNIILCKFNILVSWINFLIYYSWSPYVPVSFLNLTIRIKNLYETLHKHLTDKIDSVMNAKFINSINTLISYFKNLINIKF